MIAIAGRELICSHCGHNEFTEQQFQLTPAIFGLFSGLDTTASAYLCANCGHMEWFFQPLEVPIEEIVDDLSEAITCLQCGTTIPAGANECPSCGWSYASGAKRKPRPSVSRNKQRRNT